MIGRLFPSLDWVIHNPLKSWTLHGLTEREVRMVAATLSLAEQNLVLVWKKSWPQWQRLKDTELCKSPFVTESIGAPAIPANAMMTEDEITQVRSHVAQAQKFRKDRRHLRFDAVVPVEIVQADQVFKTETLDVSESGIRFKEKLPDWLAGYFTVIVRTEAGGHEIVCSLVEDQKDMKNCAEVIDTKDEESGLPQYVEWVRSLEKKFKT